MRLRVHDDGRWALGVSGEFRSMQQAHGVEHATGPGWRELVVLDPDADARRLAEAIEQADVAASVGRLFAQEDHARAVLDRLTGTGGDR